MLLFQQSYTEVGLEMKQNAWANLDTNNGQPSANPSELARSTSGERQLLVLTKGKSVELYLNVEKPNCCGLIWLTIVY